MTHVFHCVHSFLHFRDSMIQQYELLQIMGTVTQSCGSYGENKISAVHTISRYKQVLGQVCTLKKLILVSLLASIMLLYIYVSVQFAIFVVLSYFLLTLTRTGVRYIKSRLKFHWHWYILQNKIKIISCKS